ncbi:DUF domain-containing protein, partial [Enterobacter cloacae complex sp. 4DZ1-17B1]|uniref:DUF domain-containing protein n=1 Tax=Enterobacter cloacae complex sp. 4DZ1-17B1 TaxID=2511991 RepID=UPI001C676703
MESHDASDSGKAAEMLAAEWTSTIEITVPENFLCMVADGEASNRTAGAIIEGMYPNIHVTFCMAHCLNNLLKDIGNLSLISPTIGDASRIVSFVLNHQKVRHEFSKRSHLSLLKYSETRFAFNWLMLGRLST